MDVKGYYKTLGITDEEQKLPNDQFNEVCKKKYKKLCLKWHPDKWVNGTDEEKKKAEEEFKKVAEAYGVLSDENKRKQYDSGMDGQWQDMGGGGFDPFAEMFRRAAQGGGFGDFFGGFGNRQQRQNGHPGEDVNAYVTISFAESLKECEKEITIKKKVMCPDCNGTGSEDGKDHTCPHCNGTGMETRTEQHGNAFTMFQTPCSHCHGTGKQIDHPCKKCGGTGTVFNESKMKLTIPAGVRNGMTISYPGLGDSGVGPYPPGNLYLTVIVKADIPSYFKVSPSANDIIHEEEVDFVDAILGTKITVKCPDNSDWQIKLHECTQPGEKYKKSGAGYKPNGQWGGTNKGDYVVKINYKVPSSLTKAQRKALEEYKKEK